MEADVSVATVSRILTGSARVKPTTSQKVLAVLEKHGFDIAQLKKGKNLLSDGVLIFNIPSSSNPFYSQITEGAKAAAGRRGFQLVVNEEHINNNTLESIVALIHKVNAAGLIIANHVSKPFLQRLNSTIALVQCCEFDGELDIPYVSIDDIGAAVTAMEYLISQGRKTIALINGPIRYKYARHRLQGYRETLEKSNLPVDPELIIQLPDINYDMAVSAIIQLFKLGKKPDAFFCASDVFAAAVIKAVKLFGLSVPGDIAVVGFDNVEISFMSNPALTTVNQPKFQLGFSSCELLIERITNPKTPVRKIHLGTELIVRESSAPLFPGLVE
jgi:LacI family repressor for deo operon, udp, cdd, tsx, nupC, and nupG